MQPFLIRRFSMTFRLPRLCVVLSLVILPSVATAENWPQFRGVGSRGVVTSEAKLPTEIGPDKQVAWKTPLPPGHSSPVVFADRIFLTAEREGKLVTIAVDRASGKVLWERVAPHQKLEAIHRIGNHAQSTPTSDGKRVVTFFGSCGLFCYDIDGKLQWHHPLGPFTNTFGAATSPIIVGNRVILCQDHDTDSFLAAYDLATGKTVWKTDRSEFPRNYCTPIVWNVGGKRQIVVAATLRVVGYDIDTGKELWTVRGIARAVCMTPVIGANNNLYVAGYAGGGDPGSRIKVDPFDAVVKKIDTNGNGTFEKDELTEGGPMHRRFDQVDRDKTGRITKKEYEYFRSLFDKSRNVVVAIKPGGKGEATESHKLWEQPKFVPFCSSPLYYQGHIYTLKDGGIFASLDAKTGKTVKVGRVASGGGVYASAVAGDGKIYLLNERGKLTVVRAGEEWETIHEADFEEDTYGTPALVDGRIYLRTNGHLYCFAKK
jgi:outer membrane protein assembly factor BamB